MRIKMKNGFFLTQIDCAAFQNNKLVMYDQIASPQSNIIPDFCINFNVSEDADGEKDVIELPLYSNSSREHLICTIKLRTNIPRDTIILAGVALIVPENV